MICFTSKLMNTQSTRKTIVDIISWILNADMSCSQCASCLTMAFVTLWAHFYKKFHSTLLPFQFDKILQTFLPYTCCSAWARALRPQARRNLQRSLQTLLIHCAAAHSDQTGQPNLSSGPTSWPEGYKTTTGKLVYNLTGFPMMSCRCAASRSADSSQSHKCTSLSQRMVKNTSFGLSAHFKEYASCWM